MSRLPVDLTIGSVWLRAKTELHKKVKLAVFSIKTVHFVCFGLGEEQKEGTKQEAAAVTTLYLLITAPAPSTLASSHDFPTIY